MTSGILSFLLLAAASCVGNLAALAPFPCAKNGKCPDGFWCNAKSECWDCNKDPSTGEGTTQPYCFTTTSSCEVPWGSTWTTPPCIDCEPISGQGCDNCQVANGGDGWASSCESACRGAVGADGACHPACDMIHPACASGTCQPIHEGIFGPVVDGVYVGVCL
jgi:hypothetical protein